MTIIIFLIVLAVLVFVHEFGHFLVARACGIRVDVFALGFGPKIVGWKGVETEYRLNLIPLGGYVKIFGENPDVESLVGDDAKRSFVNQSRVKQALVLSAGVIANFVLAWVLYTGAFVFGVTATTSSFDKYPDRFVKERVMITYILSDSPAEKAGIKAGDVLKTKEIKDIQELINKSEGKPIILEYIRKNENRKTEIIPVKNIVDGVFAIGIAMDKVGELKLPFFTAIYEGFLYTGNIIKETTIGLGQFVYSIFKGTADFASVTGPVGIAGIVGGAAELGFAYLIMITAIISINLGVINLIPFPALDGGRLLFVFIESITRRRIPHVFANAVNTIGFALLMLLMVFVTYKDIAKLVK